MVLLKAYKTTNMTFLLLSVYLPTIDCLLILLAVRQVYWWNLKKNTFSWVGIDTLQKLLKGVMLQNLLKVTFLLYVLFDDISLQWHSVMWYFLEQSKYTPLHFCFRGQVVSRAAPCTVINRYWTFANVQPLSSAILLAPMKLCSRSPLSHIATPQTIFNV